MQPKHTPGPWASDENGLITAGKNRLHVAQAMTTGMGKAADANARLIAAAPELLAALQVGLHYTLTAAALSQALARINRDNGFEGNAANHESARRDAERAVETIRAAVARATGEA